MQARLQRSRRSRQHGAVALLFGLTLVMLIGFAGLALDLGRFFVVKSELQNAMDACALSAASQLRPGQNSPSALTRSVAYGRVFSTGGTGSANGIAVIKNRGNFQSDVVDIVATDITFSDTLGGPYETSTNARYNTAKYVRCSYTLTGIPVLFMHVLRLQGEDTGPDTQHISAMAVATLGPSANTCAIPLGVCMAAGGSEMNDYGLTPGDWIRAKSSDPYGSGNFGWVDFSPPGGGASELFEMLTGSGQCDLRLGDPVGEQGQKTSLDVAWNSRFGWYTNDPKAQLGNAVPDFTGYAYSVETNWPAGRGAYAGTSTVPGALNYQAASNTYAPYQGNVPKGIKDNRYTASTPAQHQTGRKNRRIAVAPVLDCTVWNTNPGSAQPAVKNWACVLLLSPIATGNPGTGDEAWDTATVEFIGLANQAGTPCATGGAAGAGGPLVPQLVQ